MARFRIVKETYSNGKTIFAVQRKSWIPFLWLAPSLMELDYANALADRFDNLEEAVECLKTYENIYSSVIKKEILNDHEHQII